MWWKYQENQNQSLEMTELLQSHDKTRVEQNLVLMNEQRKWFPEMEITPSEDAVKTVETTTKNLRVSHKLNWWQGLTGLTQIWIKFNHKCHQITLPQRICS